MRDSGNFNGIRDLTQSEMRDSPKFGHGCGTEKNDIWYSYDKILGCGILVKKGAIMRDRDSAFKTLKPGNSQDQRGLFFLSAKIQKSAYHEPEQAKTLFL